MALQQWPSTSSLLCYLPMIFAKTPAGNKLSCWVGEYSWQLCCSGILGGGGNEHCWDNAWYTHQQCCVLAPWNSHELGIPFFGNSQLRVLMSARLRYSELILHQEGRNDGDPRQYRENYNSGFLWRGGYQLMRWFDCFADRPAHAWEGRTYIEFGAGIGAAALVAVLNGAFATIIDVDAERGLILRNVRENLPPALWSRARVCSLNWSLPLIAALQTLTVCEGAEVPPTYDIIAMAAAPPQGFVDLARLMRAVSGPASMIFIAYAGPLVSYRRRLAPILEMPGRFTLRAVWRDGGMTAFRHHTLAELQVRDHYGGFVTHTGIVSRVACGRNTNKTSF